MYLSTCICEYVTWHLKYWYNSESVQPSLALPDPFFLTRAEGALKKGLVHRPLSSGAVVSDPFLARLRRASRKKGLATRD